MKKHGTPLSCTLAALLCCALLAGCTDEQADNATEAAVPGVTDSTIVLGTWAPLTGPAAPWGAVARGMEAYFKMVNDEGGINGRRVRFILKDDQYQPARTVAAVKEMAERDQVFAFAGGVGTATSRAVMDYIVERGIPWVGVLSGAHYWTLPTPHDNVFGGLPLYFEEAAVLVNYAVDEMDLTKVAILYQNDDFGKSGLVGAQMALEAQGLEMTEAVSVELMDSDLSSQALRLREAGAEAVLLYVTPRHAANLVGEAAKLGFQPQWMGAVPLQDVELMHSLTGGLWEGTIFATLQEPPYADSPTMQKFRAAREKYAPDERGGYLFYGGMLTADYIAEGLRRAGSDLTRASFIDQVAALDGYRTIGAPISFESNARLGLRAVQLVRCVAANEIELLQDWTAANIDTEAAIQRVEGGT